MNEPERTHDRTWLLVILIAAALLRSDGLGTRSLGLDEAYTWSAATRPTIVDAATYEANQPPVWYALEWANVSAFGDSLWTMRAPSALLGVLAVLLAYFLAKRCLSEGRWRGGALVVAGLAALNPLWIAQSQEARMYSALLVEILAASLLYLRYHEDGRRLDLVLYAVVAALALHTQHVAAFLLLPLGLHALGTAIRERGTARRRAWLSIAALCVAAGAFLPWLSHALRVGTSYWTAENPRVLMHTVESIFRLGAGPGIAAKRNGLREELPRLIAPSLIWLGALLAAAARAWRAVRVPGFVVLSIIVPVVLLALGSLSGTFVHERYLITVAGFVLIAIVGAAVTLPRRWGGALVAAVGLLEAAGTVAHLHPEWSWVRTTLSGRYVDHVRSGGDWAAAYGWVRQNARERGDVLASFPNPVERTWQYYDRTYPESGAPPRLYRRLIVITGGTEGTDDLSFSWIQPVDLDTQASGGLILREPRRIQSLRFPSWSSNAVRVDVFMDPDAEPRAGSGR